MKQLIKERLRGLIEAKTDRHTPANVRGVDKSKPSEADFERVFRKILTTQSKFGNDPYMQDTHEGDGVYMVTILKNGELTVRTPNPNKKLHDGDIGLMWSGPRGYRHVYVRAYRGAVDPQLGTDRTGQSRGKSPAEDAANKVYMTFGKDILEFVKQNMSGEDDYTSDIEDKDFKSKTSDKDQYKYDKLEKEKSFKRQDTISGMSADEKIAQDLKQQRLKDKYEKLKNRRRGL